MAIAIELVKQHCRVDHGDEDELLTHYLNAATGWVAKYTGHALSEETIVVKLAKFAERLDLGVEPVKSITGISYLDTDGAAQELTPTDFRVYDGGIYPQANTVWPSTLSHSDVEVTAVVGYADDEVPAELDQAILLLVAHQYENREAVVVGTIASSLPMGVVALAHPYRGERV